ncbi:MAG TPA: SDR family NAD(P)-dependent oxidoreductase [Dehalococcoidales bacterium]|nr:SDR family NAD(P)-dependent oxidoreductase [Dehalococcoidales bacterium]
MGNLSDDLLNLTGKRAIVTGGAKGIGQSIGRRLVQVGVKLLIVDIDDSALQSAVADLGGKDAGVFHVICDVTDDKQVAAMVGQATALMGGVDILVNNAGIYPRTPFLETTGAAFEKVLSVNLTGTYNCSRHAARQMVAQGDGGSIINIASIEGLRPASNVMCSYDVSKAGVVMFTRTIAKELGAHGIRVNAIAPGAIKTAGLTSQMGPSAGRREQLEELKNFLKRITLGRLGDGDDIAGVVLFLASDMSAYITGDVIVVDGGILLN